MVRKNVTYIECDACPHSELVESPKKLIFGFGLAPYPPGWVYVQFGDGQGDWLCPKCAKGAQDNYTQYKQKRQQQQSSKSRKR